MVKRKPKKPIDESKYKRKAKVMVEIYNTIMMTRLYPGRRGSLDGYSDLTKTARDHFLRAAKSCAKIKAKPRDYIMAQFDAFSRMSRGMRRVMMPQPNMIFGLKAQTRYLEWQSTQERIRRYDSDTVTPADRKFFREERKLAAWSKRARIPAADILVEYPTEFTQLFLVHKGVWEKVEDKYERLSAEE